MAEDNIDCTWDSCDPILGLMNRPDDSICSDEDLCTGVEFCDPSLDCQDGPAPVVDDGIACTVDHCSPFEGVSNTPVDSFCDDGNLCTGVEFCSTTLDCQEGTPPVVDDGIACTADRCSALIGVTNTPSDAACDDGDVCTGRELCSPTLGCLEGTPLLIVDDGVDCTTDLCDPVDGLANVPNHDVCSDGSLCNGSEVCDGTQGCIGGEAPVALVWEDFESLPLQSDGSGVFVPAVGETFYSVSDIGGTVASVLAVEGGSAAISQSPLGDQVWRIESTSEGPFVADASIPTDPDAELGRSGALATFFSEPVDLRSASMCVDVREVFQQRGADLRFVIGDADGNYSVSAPIGPLAADFETFEHTFKPSSLEAMDGANAVDLTRVQTLGFDFWTSEGAADPFEIEVDDLRLIPEPDPSLLTFCALGTLWVLRASRTRGRRCEPLRGVRQAQPEQP
ncbi:MAG: hypothetical protein JRG96_19790 [Deltaproteobacteria bacterium]|nr:hypothetical protein [Deltaproteobacteria bacterium]